MRPPVARLLRLHEGDIAAFIPAKELCFDFLDVRRVAGDQELEVLHLLIGNARVHQR